ncbi:MAG: hypothetical protein U1F41_11290 [Burkholderiales bacterium]
MHVATRIEKAAPEALRMRSAQVIEELLCRRPTARTAVDQLCAEREQRRQTPGSI